MTEPALASSTRATMQPPHPAPVKRPARAPASRDSLISVSSSSQLHSYSSLHPCRALLGDLYACGRQEPGMVKRRQVSSDPCCALSKHILRCLMRADTQAHELQTATHRQLVWLSFMSRASSDNFCWLLWLLLQASLNSGTRAASWYTCRARCRSLYPAPAAGQTWL